MKKAGELILPFIKNLGIEDNIRLNEIKKDWDSLFKEPLSFHIYPFRLSEGEILINVDSPVWMQELKYYRDDIVKKLNGYGVKEVRFKIGRVSRRKISNLKSQISNVRRLTAEELSYVEKTVSQISDDKLKETVKKAMVKALIKGQTKK
ncbi:MAG: DciA family protein [Thermodesulfovibrionales bacterium]